MPHFILEHSTNIEENDLLLNQLFEKLHKAAVESTLFPLAGIRSRAHPCKDYRIADGNPDYAFVHLLVKIGKGRSEEELKQVSTLFFSILTEHFEKQSNQRGFAMSYEMTELPEVLKFNKNNLRDYIN